MMDIEKLIHCLQCCSRVDAHNIGCDDCGLEYCGPECQQLCGTAATALSTLQAENKRLNKIVCSIPTTPDSGRTVSQYDKEMSMCAYLDDLEAENEKLRAELERMKEIMRYNGIMVIPSKYPGGRSEWNIPKPRG